MPVQASTGKFKSWRVQIDDPLSQILGAEYISQYGEYVTSWNLRNRD
jgi:hypothetical protein